MLLLAFVHSSPIGVLIRFRCTNWEKFRFQHRASILHFNISFCLKLLILVKILVNHGLFYIHIHAPMPTLPPFGLRDLLSISPSTRLYSICFALILHTKLKIIDYEFSSPWYGLDWELDLSR